MGEGRLLVTIGVGGLLCGGLLGIFFGAPAAEPQSVDSKKDRVVRGRVSGGAVGRAFDGGGASQVGKVVGLMDEIFDGDDCLRIAKILSGDPENRNSMTLWSLVLARWSIVDPQGMMDFVQGPGGSQVGVDVRSLAWYAWAASDPEGVKEQAHTMGGPLRLAVLRGMAAVDPELALRTAFEMREANSTVNAVLRSISDPDPELVRGFLSRAVYDGMRQPMEDALVKSYLREDPKKALEFAQGQGRIWSDPVAKVIGETAVDRPEVAVSLLEELPSSRSRAISTVEVARSWASNDPQAALDWVRQQEPGEILNTSLVAVASAMGGSDPVGALALLSEVGWKEVGAFYAIGRVNGPESVFDQVQSHRAIDLTEVAQDLMRNFVMMDREGARAYVAEEVPPAWQEKFKKIVEE